MAGHDASGVAARRETARRARVAEVRRVLAIVLVLNLVVVVGKGTVWWISNALSVAAEATQSSVDALNNVLALTLARVAAQAPDEDHPYGHQKFETLGALAVVALLSITCFELVQHAILRLTADEPPVLRSLPLAIGVMLISAVFGLFVSIYERRRGRALDSDLLLADAAHTRADVWAALAVSGGLVAVNAGYPFLDPIVAIGVALLIARTGWKIVQGTVPVLVDERAVEARAIRRMALAIEGVRECYGVRSRGRRGEVFAELTIAVDAGLDVHESHAIADEVEGRIAERVDAREVVVHVEPALDRDVP